MTGAIKGNGKKFVDCEVPQVIFHVGPHWFSGVGKEAILDFQQFLVFFHAKARSIGECFVPALVPAYLLLPPSLCFPLLPSPRLPFSPFPFL